MALDVMDDIVAFNTYPRMAGDLTGDGRAEFLGCASDGPFVYGHDTYLDFSYDPHRALVSATLAEVYTDAVTKTTTALVER